MIDPTNSIKPISPLDGYYNFKTEEYDYLADLPDNLQNYLPQEPIIQAAYQTYLKLGYSDRQTYIKVTEAYFGQNKS